jgi:transcriptional regulator CtsR
MELIECCNGNGYINEVKVLVTENKLLYESVLYRIGYAKVIDNDTGEDITDVFYDNYSLITNIPIINY